MMNREVIDKFIKDYVYDNHIVPLINEQKKIIYGFEDGIYEVLELKDEADICFFKTSCEINIYNVGINERVIVNLNKTINTGCLFNNSKMSFMLDELDRLHSSLFKLHKSFTEKAVNKIVEYINSHMAIEENIINTSNAFIEFYTNSILNTNINTPIELGRHLKLETVVNFI